MYQRSVSEILAQARKARAEEKRRQRASQKIIVKELTPVEKQRRLHEALQGSFRGLNADEVDVLPLPNPTPPNWHLQQKVFPKVVRLNTWLEQLQNTIDQWADYRYGTGTACCFTFACTAIDAMTGSNFLDYHRQNWRSDPKSHFLYLQTLGARDFWDVAGVRTRLEDAQLGDILQFEKHTLGRAHLHWAIKGEVPGEIITFSTHGLEEAKLPSELFSGARVWSPRFATGN
ncbi:DUF6950 family protein [Ruegeria arenilitoris]|uniref:DUF6950 family protein n=1 Tax=Ruegeria arenilitoris TaxID=1173585 RepID=UPI00147E6CB7|nr:hypothetical protein [Ruegeria arenilitoris]